MSKTTILYKDFAPGADEDAEVTSPDAIEGCLIAQLPAGVTTEDRILTCELNRWVLDGTFLTIDDKQFGFWSTALSGPDCTFEAPPVITITFDKQYTSTGVTLTFEPATGEY